jgi:hypothetical protein
MATDGTLDARYLDWLYEQVSPSKSRIPELSFWNLCEQLFRKRFEWFQPNDDNRIADGKELREEFVIETRAERNRDWMEIDCSVLEMLVALSRRCEFESSEDAYFWFWRMIQSLNLREYTDDVYDKGVEYVVNDVIDIMIHRQYRRDGVGGLFPLVHPDQDQRKVEIWYQMSAYILENGYE